MLERDQVKQTGPSFPEAFTCHTAADSQDSVAPDTGKSLDARRQPSTALNTQDKVAHGIGGCGYQLALILEPAEPNSHSLNLHAG